MTVSYLPAGTSIYKKNGENPKQLHSPWPASWPVFTLLASLQNKEILAKCLCIA